MAAKKTGTYLDYLIHPGETISEILEDRGISQSTLAARTGVSPAFVSGVVSGKKRISANFAMALEYALDVPKSFWINLQANYDAELLDATVMESIADEERSAYKALRDVVSYLRKTGLINDGASIESSILELRRVFKISNLTNLKNVVPQGAFRISEKQKVDPLVLGAWLRICQLSHEHYCVTKSFQAANIDDLIGELKELMLSCPVEKLQDQLQATLAKYGISFSIVQHFKYAPVHGYATICENGSYQMSVTIRESWADIFWFSLFHEIGHIYNGDINQKNKEFIDVNDNEDRESLADSFARDRLIDPAAYKQFAERGCYSYAYIEQFAAEQNVQPFIVIGRLQKESLIPWNRYANYKPRLKWA